MWPIVIDNTRCALYDSPAPILSTTDQIAEVRMKTPVALLGLVLLTALPMLAQDKKRVAVLDFEYQTVHQYVYDVFGSNVDIGKGIANMLVTDLVRNGSY